MFRRLWAPFARLCLGLVLVYLALHSLGSAVKMADLWGGVGWDARAYHLAWEDGLYDRSPGVQNAFNYSPVFAQLVWPLTHLPWPVFCGLFVGAAAVGVLWLCWGTPPWLLAVLLGIAATEVASGNVDWLFAVVVVLGVTRGGPWVVVAVTKVTPCLGPVWFVLRRDWRALRTTLVCGVLVCGTSFALAPGLWLDWFSFIGDNRGVQAGMYQAWMPGLGWRLAAALVLTVLAAWRSRPSWLPVAMLLAAPVPGAGPLVLLLAIPRLRAFEHGPRAESGSPAAGSPTSSPTSGPESIPAGGRAAVQ